MATVNMHEAKTRFSQLVADVEAGGEVVIARAGTPVARLVRADAVIPPRPQRLGGRLEGKGVVWIEEAWTAQDQRELEADFYGEPLVPGEKCGI